MAARPAATSAQGSAETVLERFLARPETPLTHYRAVRYLEAYNSRFNVSGVMEAVTELSPGGQFTYAVLNESGSEYLRKKVLRAALESEADLLASTDPSRYAFSVENYELSVADLYWEDEFSDAAPVNSARVVKLRARPRRQEAGLIDGTLYLSADTADLTRVEGTLAKNPSFWTSRIDLVRQYDRIAGVRVPVRIDRTVRVRLAGTSTLSVSYNYEMVNGIELAQ